MYGPLAKYYGWGHDAWRRMGWLELWGWVRERNRDVRAQQRAQMTDPESWAGGRDAWWQEQDRKRQQERGR